MKTTSINVIITTTTATTRNTRIEQRKKTELDRINKKRTMWTETLTQSECLSIANRQSSIVRTDWACQQYMEYEGFRIHFTVTDKHNLLSVWFCSAQIIEPMPICIQYINFNLATLDVTVICFLLYSQYSYNFKTLHYSITNTYKNRFSYSWKRFVSVHRAMNAIAVDVDVDVVKNKMFVDDFIRIVFVWVTIVSIKHTCIKGCVKVKLDNFVNTPPLQKYLLL